MKDDTFFIDDYHHYSDEEWERLKSENKLETESKLEIESTGWGDRGYPLCHGKVVHKTKKEAMFAVKGQRQAYECPECGMWHTGRSKKIKRKKR